jgi:hypothetical protein
MTYDSDLLPFTLGTGGVLLFATPINATAISLPKVLGLVAGAVDSAFSVTVIGSSL